MSQRRFSKWYSLTCDQLLLLQLHPLCRPACVSDVQHSHLKRIHYTRSIQNTLQHTHSTTHSSCAHFLTESSSPSVSLPRVELCAAIDKSLILSMVHLPLHARAMKLPHQTMVLPWRIPWRQGGCSIVKFMIPVVGHGVSLRGHAGERGLEKR